MSEPLAPASQEFLTQANGSEPPVPRAFLWRKRVLEVTEVVSRSRSMKVDRGDAYLKRHWFELKTASGATIEVYYDREARRGRPRWWLYTTDESTTDAY